MTTLLLGGRGKTSIRIAALLDATNHPFVIGSRSQSESSEYCQVKFDWMDESTWDPIFQKTSPPVQAVYMVAPPVADQVPPMTGFIEKARAHGVKRFVLLSAAPIPAGGPLYGKIHQYLIDSGLEYAVLRPTWFMENFSMELHLPTIKNESKVYSATQEGNVPWVSAEDIAAVGFRALTDTKSHNTDHVILGSELFSYDTVAEILSQTLGRKITHVKMTVPKFNDHLRAQGLPEELAGMLSGMDRNIAQGSEDRVNDEVEKVTGRPPVKLRAFVEKNREVWM